MNISIWVGATKPLFNNCFCQIIETWYYVVEEDGNENDKRKGTSTQQKLLLISEKLKGICKAVVLGKNIM